MMTMEIKDAKGNLVRNSAPKPTVPLYPGTVVLQLILLYLEKGLNRFSMEYEVSYHGWRTRHLYWKAV